MSRIIFLFRMGQGGGRTERHYLGHKGSHQGRIRDASWTHHGGIREEVLGEVFFFFGLCLSFNHPRVPSRAKESIIFCEIDLRLLTNAFLVHAASTFWLAFQYLHFFFLCLLFYFIFSKLVWEENMHRLIYMYLFWWCNNCK